MGIDIEQGDGSHGLEELLFLGGEVFVEAGLAGGGDRADAQAFAAETEAAEELVASALASHTVVFFAKLDGYG